NLQTPDELEEEDREAQSAKLQELIRRGTPKDLAAAQELMKSLAGAEPDKKPNYEEQVTKELDRIQQRVLLLNEMLNNAKERERFVEGDAYDQIAQKCRHVQPKLQKWIADSAENNPDAMDRLLLINDLINNVLQRYEAFKAGDRSATAEIDPALSSTSAAGHKARQQAAQVSLIDFDDDNAFDAPASSPSGAEGGVALSLSPAPSTPAGPSNPLDDLASLSLGGASSGSGSGGAGGLFDLNTAFAAPSSQAQQPINLFSSAPPLVPSSAAGSGTSTPTSASRPAQPPTSGSFFTNPAYAHAAPSGSNGYGGGLRPQAMGAAVGGTSPPLPPVPPKQQQQAQKKDAFADLLGDF
ncbi:hypothetical protein JCM10207_001184, partial [Rhodosporidiobolus poonsookiae]